MDLLLKVVFGFSVFAAIAAMNKGDGDLMKMFANERKELRADFRREIDELKKQNDKQSQVNADQKKENVEQKEEIKKLHAKLHQADQKNRKANRQRDAKERRELEAQIRHAIRQERHSSELKDVVESVMKSAILRSAGSNDTNSTDNDTLRKIINEQITDYLINQRICVGGRYYKGAGAHSQTVNFGYEFPRTPTVSASLAYVWNNEGAQIYMEAHVISVTKTSANIRSWAHYGPQADVMVSWLACL